MNNKCDNCFVRKSKINTSKALANMCFNKKDCKKMNVIWLEATGCSGNIISLLDADEPDIVYFLENMINLKFNNSLSTAEGKFAYEVFLDALNTEYILIADGAVSTKNNGVLNILAYYNGEYKTALETIKLAAEKAKYVIAVGTCASFGGMSAASPNPSESKSIQEILDRKVINLPGCPCNPRWVIGTIAHIMMYGEPDLDDKNRPIMFYSSTVHDNCPRRSYFDKGIFAEKLGDKECMFKLGCRGPITKADCPIDKWNVRINWPIGDNTPCIGCTNEGFPDRMEPFVKY